MKICFLHPRGSAYGGGEKSLLTTIDYMLAQGIDVCAVTFEQTGSLVNELKSRNIPWENISGELWVRMPWEKEGRDLEKGGNIFKAAMRLAHLLKTWGVDIMYTNTSVTNIGAVAAQLTNIPHIWHVRESVLDHEIYTPLVEFPNLARYIGYTSDKVIFISNYLRDQYAQYTPQDNLSVVYNQVELQSSAISDSGVHEGVDVIIPFYNDPHVLVCLESIKRFWTSRINSVMIIDDQGPDRELAAKVKKWVESNKGFEYYINSQNLGFVKTCNRGMKKSSVDVILLNTDTTVTENWIDKLQNIAYQEDVIATVSPVSNSASYFSVPDQFKVEHDGEPDESNRIVELVAPVAYTHSHVGHGFCFYIKREALNKIGYFNEKLFGKGYGEETDFCMRALKLGLKNIIACNTYIYHLEGQSFGKELKKQLQKERGKLISRMYPDIYAMEQEFHRRDPLKDIRKLFPLFKTRPELMTETKIVIVGSIEKNKGQSTAIEAIGELKKQGHNLHLLMAGSYEQSYLDTLYKLAEELGVRDYVHAVGFINNPSSLYRMSKVALVASHSEGFGRSAVEPMLMGVPLVSTTAGGLAEIVVDEENALVFEQGNSVQLANQILRLLKDEGLSNRLVANAQEYIRKTFVPGENTGPQVIFDIVSSIDVKKPRAIGISLFLSPWFYKELYSRLNMNQMLRRATKQSIYSVRKILKKVPLIYTPWVMYHRWQGKRHPEWYQDK